MDPFSSALLPLEEISVWPEGGLGSRVERTGTWKWMRPVYVRLDNLPGRVQVSWDHREPTFWDGLPIANVELEEIDIFEPRNVIVTAGAMLSYPLRVVSLPSEPLQVGDRRMIRAKPNGVFGTFELIAVCKSSSDEGSDDVLLEIGGSRRIHTVRVPAVAFGGLRINDTQDV